MAASRASWLKRLVYIWVAAAVVLVVSIGGTAAQPKSGETAAQPHMRALSSSQAHSRRGNPLAERKTLPPQFLDRGQTFDLLP
jgi:negative regulator of sigma E activity